MTDVRIPEPDTHCFDTDTGLDVWSHSKAQLKQYGDDRAREALKLAAIEIKVEADYSGSNRRAVLTWVVDKLRALKEQI